MTFFTAGDQMAEYERLDTPKPCFECGSTERIGTACKPCNPEITDPNFGCGEIPMTTPDIAGQCKKLRASAAAFREHTVYDSEGDPLRLTVQAAEADEAADTIERQAAEIERLRGALRNIQIEAEREEGRWVHLKRVIAINARAALTGEDA